MLSFRVIVALHPRRPLVARRSTLPVNVLDDRCPRTIEAHVMERISRQPRASRGVGLVLLQAVFLPRGVLTSLRCFIFSKSFICNIYAPARPSVANKRLTRRLNPLDATFTRNRGVGYFPPSGTTLPRITNHNSRTADLPRSCRAHQPCEPQLQP